MWTTLDTMRWVVRGALRGNGLLQAAFSFKIALAAIQLSVTGALKKKRKAQRD